MLSDIFFTLLVLFLTFLGKDLMLCIMLIAITQSLVKLMYQHHLLHQVQPHITRLENNGETNLSEL